MGPHSLTCHPAEVKGKVCSKVVLVVLEAQSPNTSSAGRQTQFMTHYNSSQFFINS